MSKAIERCLDLLSTLGSLRNPEEYGDTLVDLILNLKLLVERLLKDSQMTDESLLCCHQITTCLKFLTNRKPTNVLQYFEARIHFCLTELQKQGQSDETPGVPESVLTTVDQVVDLLESHIESQSVSIDDLTDAIDGLLSQALLFRTITLTEDQKKIMEMLSRCILNKKLQLRKDKGNSQLESLIVEDLKRSVIELEQLLNNCLLRLFVTVLVALDDDPFASDTATFNETDFDLLMDRLIQLGIIAIGFTDSGSVKLNLRSAVASLESLDLHLVPLLLNQTDNGSAKHREEDTFRHTLIRHWREETAKLSINIHKIIDTKAFAGALSEWLSEQLNRNEARAKGEGIRCCIQALDAIRKMFLVFHRHLCLCDIGSGEGGVLQNHSKDMRIMLNECKAVLKYAEQVEVGRIFKRFRLLLHILEKIRRDLPAEEEELEERTTTKSHVLVLDDDVIEGADYDEPTEYFTSFGISMAATSRVFYRKQQRVRRADHSSSMIPQFSSVLLLQPKHSHSHWQRLTRRGTKRPSGVFRPSCHSGFNGTSGTHPVTSHGGQAQALVANGEEESLQLNITEILEQLTKFSETFAE